MIRPRRLRIAAILAVLAAIVWLVATQGFSRPALAAPSLVAVPIGTFEDPVYVAAAPAHPRLLFVVERAGRIMVLRDEAKLANAVPRHPRPRARTT